MSSSDKCGFGRSGRFASKTFQHDHDHGVTGDNAKSERSRYGHDECGGSEDGPHSYPPVSLMYNVPCKLFYVRILKCRDLRTIRQNA
jgi:hypothetical protein